MPNINLQLDSALFKLLQERRTATGCAVAEYIRRAIRSALVAEFHEPVATANAEAPFWKPDLNLDAILGPELLALKHQREANECF